MKTTLLAISLLASQTLYAAEAPRVGYVKILEAERDSAGREISNASQIALARLRLWKVLAPPSNTNVVGRCVLHGSLDEFRRSTSLW